MYFTEGAAVSASGKLVALDELFPDSDRDQRKRERMRRERMKKRKRRKEKNERDERGETTAENKMDIVQQQQEEEKNPNKR